VPCLHDEPFAAVRRVAAMFRRVRGCLFNTEPERRLAHRLFGGGAGDGSASPWTVDRVVGFSLPEPGPPAAQRVPSAGLPSGPYLAYCGRREPLKGTPLLLDYWAAFRRLTGRDVKLVLTGSGPVTPPDGMAPHIVDLGYVDDAAKRAVMAGAVAFCHPSVNESLSIVLLEAWQQDTPALVHASGEVLRHQCRAAGGGLWFRDCPEFIEALNLLLDRPDLARAMGRAGHAFVRREYAPQAVCDRLLGALDA
jgi:glycosyltransferase involved in cell wall biosynthesis